MAQQRLKRPILWLLAGRLTLAWHRFSNHAAIKRSRVNRPITDSEWTPRERVHLLALTAGRRSTNNVRRLMDGMRRTIVAQETRPDPPTPEWDWTTSSRGSAHKRGAGR